MNAVEIEQAVSELAGQPFDPVEFPFAFLESFGNKPTTIKRLRSGATNQSDVGGVLQRNNIHIKVCAEGEAAATLRELQHSAATPRAKAKFLLATDGGEIQAEEIAIVVPRVSSENREYLPVGLVSAGTIIGDRNFALYDAPLWNLGLIASKLHYIWIATVCGRLEMRLSYSNTLGWNTFPVPTLTRQNKADLAQCAETILLAREAHFPATIAELYDPARMPANLKAAHERNDEVLERIYIGRRFRNDTERLEKLFEMYATMTEGGS